MMQISEEYFEELNRQSKRLSDLLWGLIRMEDALYKEECRVIAKLQADIEDDAELDKVLEYNKGLKFGIDIIRKTRREYYEKTNKYNA